MRLEKPLVDGGRGIRNGETKGALFLRYLEQDETARRVEETPVAAALHPIDEFAGTPSEIGQRQIEAKWNRERQHR